MSAGLTSQAGLIAAEAQAGKIKVMTPAQAGQWFIANYSVTPPTSVFALDDWQTARHEFESGPRLTALSCGHCDAPVVEKMLLWSFFAPPGRKTFFVLLSCFFRTEG
jgi:hypothetical protein